MTGPQSLAPGLLLAAPSLGDANFERTVVLLGHHDEDGALGWVLNGRAIAPVARLLADAGLVPPGVRLPSTHAYGRQVRLGGPVSPGSAWMVFRQPEDEEVPGAIPMDDGWAFTCHRDAIEAVARGDGVGDFWLYLGYSGWGPQQLEGEIHVGAWLPAPLDLALLELDAEDLWDAAYHRAVGAPPAAFTGGTRGSA